MTLREWIEAKPRGEISRLMRATGLAYTTILEARDRSTNIRSDTAQKISDATGGAVSVAELCERPKDEPVPTEAEVPGAA